MTLTIALQLKTSSNFDEVVVNRTSLMTELHEPLRAAGKGQFIVQLARAIPRAAADGTVSVERARRQLAHLVCLDVEFTFTNAIDSVVIKIAEVTFAEEVTVDIEDDFFLIAPRAVAA